VPALLRHAAGALRARSTSRVHLDRFDRGCAEGDPCNCLSHARHTTLTCTDGPPVQADRLRGVRRDGLFGVGRRANRRDVCKRDQT